MKNYTFKLGKTGKADFKIKEDTLVLSVQNDGVSHSIIFNDFIKPHRHFCDSSAYTEDISISTYNDSTKVSVSGNEILFTTEIIGGLFAFNRFTVCEDTARILLEVFFESDRKIYDCAPVIATTKVDMEGFELLGGAGTDVFFPIEM